MCVKLIVFGGVTVHSWPEKSAMNCLTHTVLFEIWETHSYSVGGTRRWDRSQFTECSHPTRSYTGAPRVFVTIRPLPWRAQVDRSLYLSFLCLLSSSPSTLSIICRLRGGEGGQTGSYQHPLPTKRDFARQRATKRQTSTRTDRHGCTHFAVIGSISGLFPL